MIKSTKMTDSTPSANEHTVIGDVLLHSHSELKPIRIVVETPPVVLAKEIREDDSIPRVISFNSSRKTFVHKMDENHVKPPANVLDHCSLMLRSMAKKKIEQLHRTSDVVVEKLKSKASVVNTLKKTFSRESAECQITFF